MKKTTTENNPYTDNHYSMSSSSSWFPLSLSFSSSSSPLSVLCDCSSLSSSSSYASALEVRRVCLCHALPLSSCSSVSPLSSSSCVCCVTHTSLPPSHLLSGLKAGSLNVLCTQSIAQGALGPEEEFTTANIFKSGVSALRVLGRVSVSEIELCWLEGDSWLMKERKEEEDERNTHNKERDRDKQEETIKTETKSVTAPYGLFTALMKQMIQSNTTLYCSYSSTLKKDQSTSAAASSSSSSASPSLASFDFSVYFLLFPRVSHSSSSLLPSYTGLLRRLITREQMKFFQSQQTLQYKKTIKEEQTKENDSIQMILSQLGAVKEFEDGEFSGRMEDQVNSYTKQINK